MAVKKLAFFFAFFSFSSFVLAEKVAFPSGATLLAHGEDVEKFKDSQRTGSSLFRVGDEGVTDSKRLTLSLEVGAFRDKTVAFFRAHPVFMTCLQKVWSEVQNSGRRIVLKQGYKLTTGSTKQEVYSRAGTGASVGFEASEPKKSFTLVAASFLRHCPLLFAPLGLDLGLIIAQDSVFAFMTGHASPSKWSIEAQGENPEFKGIKDLRIWAMQRLNEVTQPKSVPKCGVDVPELQEGRTHPPGASLDIVGPPDRPVSQEADLLRLIQFPSDNMQFQVAPEQLGKCPQDGGFLGNGASTRCPPRQMAPRLFLCLNRLQQMARAQLGVSLKVTSGWAEDAKGLRAEGRELLLQSSNIAILGKVGRLAVCAGCDFVGHEKNFLRLAVMKQFSASSSPIYFPSAEILPVAAPHSEWLENYKPRPEFDSDDFPLLDGALSKNVSEGVPLSLFRSKEAEIRYLRLHPAIVKCYSEILRWENRHISSADPKIALKITQAFMSMPQEKSLMSPLIDERLDTHTLGIGLQIAYEKPSSKYTVWRLAETIASVCPLVFKTMEEKDVSGRSIGIGIYKNDVHLDMRYSTKVWFQCEDCDMKPPGGTEAFRLTIESLTEFSANNRLIDPSDFHVSCKFDDPPSLQGASFSHKEPEAVKRVRRATSGSPECQMNAPMDESCTQSLSARKMEVDKIWKIISYKHFIVSKVKVLAALNGCLLSCSKCSSGPQWDAKMMHCDNLIHWVPFGLQNTAPGVRSNFYARGDKDAERMACESGDHCVDLSPLNALFVDSLLARFRPVTSKPNSELIYDPVGNPSPLPVLIRKIYAFSAQGEAKVFLRSEADVISMASSLKTLFVYNKNVTKVHVVVLDQSSQNVVVAALEASLEQWRTTACPTTARQSLTPYSIEIAPQVTSQSAAFAERHRVRDLWEKWYCNEQRSDFL